MQNARWDELQAGINVAEWSINNLRYADNTILMVKSKDKLKSLLIKVKESEKAGLKLNIQKTNSMAFSPTTSWQPEGENVETVADFIILGSKITADGDCTREIKRRLFPGRKPMMNLDNGLKRRDITLPTKVRIVKAMVSPVIMNGCKSWTIKKAECLRLWTSELCTGRLLRAPWIARSNQSTLKDTNLNIHWKDWCWNWSSNILATSGEGRLIGKDLDVRKDWRQKEKGATEGKMVG